MDYIFNLWTEEAEADTSLWGGQPGLHGEFQTSQVYITKPFLKNTF